MSLARSIIVDEILPLIDYASIVTVRIFHSVGDNNNKSHPKINKIYDGEFDKVALSQKILELPDPINTGGTPISAALKVSIDTLASFPEDDRKIILVTDGQETDGGDYIKTAEEALQNYGVPCKIFIVGIAQSAEAENKSIELTKATGGFYVPLQAKDFEKSNIQSLLRPLKKEVIKSSIENTTIVNEKEAQAVLNSPLRGSSSLITEDGGFPQDNTSITNLESPQAESSGLEINTHKLQGVEASKMDQYLPIGQNSNIDADLTKKIINSLDQNNIALKLISKQLEIISEEISEIKKDEFEESEPAITEIPELNEKIRIASESFLFEKLSEKLGSRIKWLNQAGESGCNHDFEVLDVLDDTIEYFIECKGTMYDPKVFYLTKNEWHFFLENSKNYQLYLVTNALNNPTLIKIDNFKDWLLRGKLVPYLSKNIRLKAERIPFEVLS